MTTLYVRWLEIKDRLFPRDIRKEYIKRWELDSSQFKEVAFPEELKEFVSDVAGVDFRESPISYSEMSTYLDNGAHAHPISNQRDDWGVKRQLNFSSVRIKVRLVKYRETLLFISFAEHNLGGSTKDSYCITYFDIFPVSEFSGYWEHLLNRCYS